MIPQLLFLFYSFFLHERFIYDILINSVMKHKKSEFKIPANVDPIKLADEIKGDMTAEWIKRREKIKSKPLLVQRS